MTERNYKLTQERIFWLTNANIYSMGSVIIGMMFFGLLPFTQYEPTKILFGLSMLSFLGFYFYVIYKKSQAETDWYIEDMKKVRK